jgi:histidine triad (HIT) family protein
LPSQRDECLFCSIIREGSYVRKDKGFVAIKDINPQAPVHLLVIPERHVDSFREIGEFPARETKRMLEFGPTAGQTIFHLHWHILGEGPPPEIPASADMAVAEL